MQLPTNTTEANALDTNGDGQFSVLDSPFAPYWPGDDYVDWVGLSVYYKGPNSQNINVLQPVGYCYGALSNYNPNTGLSAPDPWYETYCENKEHVACMFAESGAAYHDMILGDQGVSDLALKQRWWEDCLVGLILCLSLSLLPLLDSFLVMRGGVDPTSRDKQLIFLFLHYADYRQTQPSSLNSQD